MKIDLTILMIAIIFLPGIMGSKLVYTYSSYVKPNTLDYLLNIFVLGLSSYGLTYVLYNYTFLGSVAEFNLTASALPAGNLGSLKSSMIDDIVVAIIVGLILSVLWIFVQSRRYISKILNRFTISNRYGDEDVFSYVLNLDENFVRFVYVRDLKTNSIYAGYVSVFSEKADVRELLLRDVEVYDYDTGVPIYKAKHIYLARDANEMLIEFPDVSQLNWSKEK